jgi:signal transduction protein with GAF and PtsI domain
MTEHPSTMVADDAERFRIIKKIYLQRERELAAAQRISEALAQRMKMRDLVEQALRTTLDILNAENGSLLLADADRKELVFCQSIGDKPVPYGTAIPWTRGIAGAVFQSGKAEVLSDAQKDPRYLADIDFMCGSVTHDMITMPLKKWQGDPIGVVQVMNKRHGQLDEQDVGVLTITCALSALAIEQARFFEQTKDGEVAQERIEALTQSEARLRGLATELNLALVAGKMKVSQARGLPGLSPSCLDLLNEIDQALIQSLTYTRTLVADLAPPD